MTLVEFVNVIFTKIITTISITNEEIKIRSGIKTDVAPSVLVTSLYAAPSYYHCMV